MLKKAVVIVIALFVVYYLLVEPAGAADAVSGAINAVMEALGQLFVFFETLTG